MMKELRSKLTHGEQFFLHIESETKFHAKVANLLYVINLFKGALCPLQLKWFFKTKTNTLWPRGFPITVKPQACYFLSSARPKIDQQSDNITFIFDSKCGCKTKQKHFTWIHFNRLFSSSDLSSTSLGGREVAPSPPWSPRARRWNEKPQKWRYSIGPLEITLLAKNTWVHLRQIKEAVGVHY